MGGAQIDETGIVSAAAQNLVNVTAIVSPEIVEDVQTAVVIDSKITEKSLDLLTEIESNIENDKKNLVASEFKITPNFLFLNNKKEIKKDNDFSKTIVCTNKEILEICKKKRARQWNILKLFIIGIALTCITNFPSAFMHTSVNTAADEIILYLKNSDTKRGETTESNTRYALLLSIINSCWYAGQVVGAVFSPIFIDHYGRKPAYLLSTGMMTLACALQMISTLFPYPEILIVGRILASMFSPMSDAVAILYLQEMSPPNLRGTLSSLFATSYSIMGLLGMVLGARPILGHSLTLLFSVPLIPGIVSMLFLIWLPETPKFLMITKKNRKKAYKSLNFFQGGILSNKNAILDSYLEEAKDELSQNTNILNFFRVLYLRKALIYSFLVMVPTLAFFPILQNSTFFFQKTKHPLYLAQIFSSFMMVFLIICCVLAAFFLDIFLRRTLILFFGFSSVISLIIFVLSDLLLPFFELLKYGALAGLYGYVMCYGLAIGPISFFMAPELVPQQNRSTMFCICFSLTSVLIVFTNFATMPLFQIIGALSFVPLFIIPSTLALIYLYLYLPETKNKETHEIIAVLQTNTAVFRTRFSSSNSHILENS